MPAATCFSMISRTVRLRQASNAACSNGRPVSRASKNSSRSGGRGRLPTWVVRIRSVLVFIPAISVRNRRFNTNAQMHSDDSMPSLIVLPGLVPGIHVFVGALEGVDAHGTSPWAEGPRAKPGQDD